MPKADFENMTRKDLAAAYGVSPITITRWLKLGLPRHKDGSYSLPETIAWTVDKARQDTPLEGETTESTKWLAEYRKERAKKERLRRKMLEGSTIEKDLVIGFFQSRISLVKNGLLLMPRSLAPDLLTCETEADISQKIESRVRHLLELFSREMPEDFTTEARKRGRHERHRQKR